MKTELFAFAQAIAHYGDEETNITQQLFNKIYRERNSNRRCKGFNNVAATALIFTDGTVITGVGTSNQTRSQTGEDDRNNHAERESLAAAIYQAIQNTKPPFNNPEFADLNQQKIKELISLDRLQNEQLLDKARKQLAKATKQELDDPKIKEKIEKLEKEVQQRTAWQDSNQEKQRTLLPALNQCKVGIYSEREFCDFQPPLQEGCKTYLDVLERKCNNRQLIQGSYSIPSDISNLPAAKMLDYMCCHKIQELIQNEEYQEAAQKIAQIQNMIFNKDNAYYAHSEQNKALRSMSTTAQYDIAQLDKQIEEILSQPPPSALAQRLAAVEGQFAQTEDISLKMQTLFQLTLENDQQGIKKLSDFRGNLKEIFKNIPNLIEKIENQLELNTGTEQHQSLKDIVQQLKELRELINQYIDNSTKSKSNIRSDIVQLINNIKLNQIAAITKEGEIEPAESSSELLSSIARQSLDLLDDDLVLEQAKQESLFSAQNQGKIGPRTIAGWELHDVEDEGNCFYDAVVHQMRLINHRFLNSVPLGTEPRDSLRLNIQEEQFKDQEWAEDKIFDEFAKKFPDLVLAIVDTRHPNDGFVYYYLDNDNNSVITNRPNMQIPLPTDKSIIKTAATGNHFLSVVSHPDLNLQHSVAEQPPAPIPEAIVAADNFEQPSSTVVQQAPQSIQQAEIVAILDTLNEKIDNLKQLSVQPRQQKRLKGQLLEEICKLVDEGKIRTGQNPEQKKTFEIFSILANRLQPLQSLLPYNDKNGWQIIELGTQILQQSITANLGLFQPDDPAPSESLHTPVSKSEAVSEKQQVTLDDLNQFADVAQQLATAPAQPSESAPTSIPEAKTPAKSKPRPKK